MPERSNRSPSPVDSILWLSPLIYATRVPECADEPTICRREQLHENGGFEHFRFLESGGTMSAIRHLSSRGHEACHASACLGRMRSVRMRACRCRTESYSSQLDEKNDNGMEDRRCTHYNCRGESGSYCTVPITPCLLLRDGREIPSLCILWISVVRFKPSLAAAPFGPPISQPSSSRARRI
jgi:hypothetical protein